MEYKIINGAISFGTNTILEEINFEILNNDKIAIVGRNGSGKTSLLKAIVDNEMLETGLGKENLQIIKIGKPSIGYQQQHAFNDLNITLLDEILKVYEPIIKLKNKIDKIEKDLEHSATIKTLEEYTKLLDRFKLNGGYEYQKEYEVALNKFGFTKEDKNKKLSEFSGGQRTKISFLKLLLSKPDILLLDEPTNHLDISTVEWLEEYLSTYPKALVVVSHDRMFLDKVVNKVYEIEYSSLTKYKGNYTSFERQKKMNYEKQLKDYEYQQKEIKRLREIAERFKYKPSKASMAMSKLKKIEQMQIIDKPQKSDVKNFNAGLQVKNESGNTVLTVGDLEIGYNNMPISKVSFELFKGQKIAVIGENGKGKSTLIKTLMGIVPKISGKFTYGYNVQKEYFDQQIEFINEENTIYEEFEQTFPNMEPVQIRKTLGTFLFNGEDVFKKINVLSGGEKVRLGLCKIFKKNPNFLLLDEPTNHLDILGKENLEEILLNYNGSVLFVSHDRYFINKIADALLIFEKDQVIYFNGKYQDYLNQKDITKEKEIVINSPKIKKQVSKDNKNIIKKLENEINKMELAKKEIESEMLKEEIYTDYLKMNELQNKLNQLDEEIIIKMQEWENLNNE
ncbi:MAG: ABC-F family ATP-binding cassette domain-containing protein [Firmicutes bacterium]|nr:ABC-F family ATP-binding cassette domain-containing protein [Bacillota bacterium]